MSAGFEHYIFSGGRRLRCGYTTGVCAALAAAGAARLLLTGAPPPSVSLETPKGITVKVPLEECRLREDWASCAVRKDAGDDIDVTAGALIFAQAAFQNGPGIAIDGGPGVGRVTKPGLDQPVGAAAINRVPRRMIAEQVEAVCRELGYTGGLEVIVSIPGGEEAASRTFNPMLGVVGGLSVLGTSGIVEPMSEQAIVDTIAVQQRQAAATGSRRVILTPGNYGADYLREAGPALAGVPVVKCSNFLGDALDIAANIGFEQVLLVAHIGKLVKVAGGIMQTHSRYADCRTELFCAHAAVCGGGPSLCRSLLDAATTDACLALLDAAGLRDAVLDSLLAAVQRHLTRRAAGAYLVGAVTFSNEYGALGATDQAKEIIETWRQEKESFTA